MEDANDQATSPPTVTVVTIVQSALLHVDIDKVLDWPPDLFAVCGLILQSSGCYLRCVIDWSPNLTETAHSDWMKMVEQTSDQWRTSLNSQGSHPPDLVVRLWNDFKALSHVSISDLRKFELADPDSESAKLCDTLLTLVAISDGACIGAGIPSDDGSNADSFEAEVAFLLWSCVRAGSRSTLCHLVDPDIVTVLPKVHTAQTGMTFRSLTHHLALLPTGEVTATWRWIDATRPEEERHGINVLVLPWPLEIVPKDFIPSSPRFGPLSTMPESFGFFQYRSSRPPDFPEKIIQAYRNAESIVGRIDMVVLPEMALLDTEVDRLAELLVKGDLPPIIVTGVVEPSGKKVCNLSVTLIPNRFVPRYGNELKYEKIRQDKHHRWRLDGSQVRQYGLSGTLDPNCSWWEDTVLARRNVNFFSFSPWLTWSVLICEDLARPDPIGEAVRAVGPNLVVALLMDGPQLAQRWPGRYGTVLADDPGSAVLTLTSLGMATLARPPGCNPSRVIGLWKDSNLGVPVEMELPPNAEGLVLCLARTQKSEFTADGRGDGASSWQISLAGLHPVVRGLTG